MNCLSDRPGVAFGLSLFAGIFVFLGGLLYVGLGTFLNDLLASMDISGIAGISSGFLVVFGVIGMVWGVAIVVAAFLINTGDPKRVRVGSILVVVFSIFGWFGSAGGIFIGFFFGLAGGIVGLVWKPKTVPAQPIASQPAQ